MSNIQVQNNDVRALMQNVNVRKRFEDILGEKAAGFMSSVTTITNNNKALAECDPKSVLSSAVVAAMLDLPLVPGLGFAHMVPYGGVATFQMGWKGFVQLAMRTGQYQTMNCSEVYEGELISSNRITGDFTFDFNAKTSDKIIGYVAYFRLTNGFEKYLYMTTEQVNKHAKKYSQTYKSAKEYVRNSSKWSTDFHAMALKTVMKLLLSKFGILSIDMQRAVQADQSAPTMGDDGEIEFGYPDGNTIDAEIVPEPVEPPKAEALFKDKANATAK
jgi:recombination protein RecT